jgi:hypothetical protein
MQHPAEAIITELRILILKLTRDKTLMQGHDCCNHKYIKYTNM